MTLEARINLQHGVPENRAHEWTNYTIESPLDAIIVQKTQNRNQLREQQQEIAFQEYINQMVEEKLQDCLEKSLEDILKSFNV